jgi:RNA polymerase sigma-70 factor (ECF subfamily)
VTVDTATQQLDEEQQALEDLLARTALNDREAFESLYEHISSRLLGFILKMLQNKAEAEDVLQDVFIKLWHKAKDYRAHEGAAMSWLYTLTRNQTIDYIRSKNRKASVSMSEAESGKQAEQNLAFYEINTEDAIAIDYCLEQLANLQKNSILQAFYFGFTYEELAQRASVPLGTVKTRIRRGLQKLKECLNR